jgi:tetratricopeptide (TPR) repeat protein
MWTAALHAAGLGAYDRALAWLGETLALCERTGELLARARVLNTIGWVHGDLGDVAGATAYNERSIATVPPSGLPDREIEANARLNLADDALMEGRLDDAEAELSELERTVRRPRPSEQWMLWRYSQRWLCTSGELAQARGDARAALALADECLPRAEDTDSRKYVVRARRLRGRALAALGRGVEAGADLHAALALARELGNPPQLWRTLIAAAEVAEDGGRRHAAEALDVIDGVVADVADDRLRTALQSGPERARAAELAAAGL